MKEITILIILAIVMQTQALSQSCLPNGIRFESQNDIDNFHYEYPDCSEIEGYVRISGGDITNLNGLNGLTSIGGYLWIKSNHDLVNLHGLDSLAFIGGNIEIIGNSNLVDLTGFESLTSIEQDLIIGDYYNGSNSSLENLDGLNNVNSIGGSLYIELVNSLLNLNGLENLSYIGNNLIIQHSFIFNSLEELNNLSFIGGDLKLGFLYALTNLEGLENISSIGGTLSLWNNDALTDLNGLRNMNSIGGDLRIVSNDSLSSLIGLENISAESIIELDFRENSNLSTCEIQSVCEYLAMPDCITEIYGNKTGCNSKSEIISVCANWITNANEVSQLLIYPNPATVEISLLSKTLTSIDYIDIYNYIGQNVLHKTIADYRIDISTLNQGIYIVEITSNELKLRQKLIIK